MVEKSATLVIATKDEPSVTFVIPPFLDTQENRGLQAGINLALLKDAQSRFSAELAELEARVQTNVASDRISSLYALAGIISVPTREGAPDGSFLMSKQKEAIELLKHFADESISGAIEAATDSLSIREFNTQRMREGKRVALIGSAFEKAKKQGANEQQALLAAFQSSVLSGLSQRYPIEDDLVMLTKKHPMPFVTRCAIQFQKYQSYHEDKWAQRYLEQLQSLHSVRLDALSAEVISFFAHCACKGETELLRCVAVRLLGMIATPELEQILAVAVRDQSVDVRCDALAGLAQYQTPTAKRIVRRFSAWWNPFPTQREKDIAKKGLNVI